ncbi:MAG: cytochrome c biogenesis protein CcsA [Coriobacteriia bacterium]
MNLEITLMWITLAVYFVSTLMFVVGVVFTKERMTRNALYVAAAGLVPQLAAVAVRWVRLGHGPYVGYYEVANALTLFTMVLFVVAALRNTRLSAIGIGVMPVAVLLLGGAMLSSKADIPITASLASYWLVIHVIFANMAFAAFVAAFGLSIAYVLRGRSPEGRWAQRLKALPDQLRVEDLSVRFVLAGFLLWGMMIVSGAIWAEESWGRYWSWDPIETWSLIVWLIYAVYLHLRYTMRWKGERLAWFSIIAMPIALFCLVGIPTVYNTIHAGYIGGVEGQLW